MILKLLDFWTRRSYSLAISCCSFVTTPANCAKKVLYLCEGDLTTVEGVYIPSERQIKIVCFDGFGHNEDKDPVSRLGLQIKHTDVLILSQFLRPDGSIIPRSVTNVSARTQSHLELMITRAKKAGLLPVNIRPDGSHVYEECNRLKFKVYYESGMIGLPEAFKTKTSYISPD